MGTIMCIRTLFAKGLLAAGHSDDGTLSWARRALDFRGFTPALKELEATITGECRTEITFYQVSGSDISTTGAKDAITRGFVLGM
jgi:hypothetical protein